MNAILRRTLRRVFLRLPWHEAMARLYASLYQFLFGNDVFVSYGRADGTRYPEALVGRLTREGLVCYYDRFGSPPGEIVSPKVLSQAKNSSVLVIVAGPSAARSENVSKEIAEFDPLKGSAVPIDFEGTLQAAVWRDLVGGISEEQEPLSALEKGEISDAVVQRIVGIEDFVSRNQRLRQVLAWGIGAVVAIVLLVLLFAFYRIKGVEERRAIAQNETARQQEIAEAFGWANQAEMLRNKDMNPLRGSVALAAKSMDRLSRLGVADLHVDRTLRKGLALLRPFREIKSSVKPAETMALSPDGRFVAVCEESPVFGGVGILLEVWSLTGEPHKVGGLPHLTTKCPDLAFHQGHLVLVGEGVLWRCEAWDTPAPNCRKLGDYDNELATLRSGDGQLISVSSSKVIQIWDLAGGPNPLSRLILKNLPGEINAKSLSLEENLLAVASFNSATGTETVHVFDAKSGKEQMRFLALEGRPARAVKALAFGAQGRLLGASVTDEDHEESEVIVWDLHDRHELARFPLREELEALAFSPDGLSLATGSSAGTRIWELSSRAEIARLQGAGADLAFSADGRWLAALSKYGRIAVFVWDLQRSSLEPPVVLGFTEEVALSHNGRYFAAGTSHGLQIWNLETAKQIGEFDNSKLEDIFTFDSSSLTFDPSSPFGPSSLIFSPSGAYLMGDYASRTGNRSWMLKVGSRMPSAIPRSLGVSFDREERFFALFGHDGIEIRGTGEDHALIGIPVSYTVLTAKISPTSSYLTFAGLNPLLEIWSLDMEHGRASRIEQFPLRGRPLDLAWSADERYLAASFEGGFILIRNTGSWPVVSTMRSRIVDFGFTAQGERLVAVTREGILWVCELQGTCTIWTATCSSVPMHLALHPGGRYAAVALRDETTEVWDLFLHRRVAHFENEARLDGLVFSGDGSLLAGISGLNGWARRWLWHPYDLLREAALRVFPSPLPANSWYARPSPAAR